MSDTKSPLRDSGYLAALKAAIAVEQRVLGLNSHIAIARTEALLGGVPGATVSAGDPTTTIPGEQAVM